MISPSETTVEPLLKNAVASLRMGIEDFCQEDEDRAISAARNIYAGILLLVKEALIRKAPNADAAVIIAAKHVLEPDGNGGFIVKPESKATVGPDALTKRAKAFGIRLNDNSLIELQRIRNELEHHYTSHSADAIRAAIAKALPIAASLFRELDEDPVLLLGDAWRNMLEVKFVYEEELRAARETLRKVEWRVPSVSKLVFTCSDCGSELLEQVDPSNEVPEEVRLRCRTCGASPALGEVLEAELAEAYRIETYIRFKDAGESGPVYRCPACGWNTLSEEDDYTCVYCGEQVDYVSECGRCYGDIPIEEYLAGSDSGLCSWCEHMVSKQD